MKIIEVDDSYRKKNFDSHKLKDKCIVFMYIDRNNEEKECLGRVKWHGKLCKDHEEILVYEIFLINNSNNGPKVYYIENKNFQFLEINEDTKFIVDKSDRDIVQCSISDFKENDHVTIDNEKYNGKILQMGKVNGFKCFLIEMSNQVKEMSPAIENRHIYLVPAVLVINDNTFWPEKLNIYTYYKVNTCVKVRDRSGIIKGFGERNDELIYKIKMDDDGKEEEHHVNDVTFEILEPFEEKKPFKKVTNPKDYGIFTKLKIGSLVKIKKDQFQCYAEIKWMGFDKDLRFKFHVEMEDEYEFGDNGRIYEETLSRCKPKHGLLIEPHYVFPDDRYNDHTEYRDKSSEIHEDKVHPPYEIKCGEFMGIQGHRNSCYLDTTLFVMFGYCDLYDYALEFKMNSSVEDLKNVLKKNIVYPLRKHGYVDRFRVERFRSLLNERFPHKNFLYSEKDPEELIESLFNYIIPKKYFFRTINYQGLQNGGYCLQLFFTTYYESLSIRDMLDLSFKESAMKLMYPPKCLILQLPRNSIEYKNFGEVKIDKELDISDLIIDNKCNNCSSSCNFICPKCSMEKKKIIGYCKYCKSECCHPLQEEVNFKTKGRHNGRIKLELFGILCIYRAHYTAFIRTNRVSNDQWVYFNSMENFENDYFIPLLRETKLHDYFSFKDNDEEEFNLDVTKIQQSAFVCFYKNPFLEPYDKDFNAD